MKKSLLFLSFFTLFPIFAETESAFSHIMEPRRRIDLSGEWLKCSVPSTLMREELEANGRKKKIYEPAPVPENAKWETATLPWSESRYPLGAKSTRLKKTVVLPDDIAGKRILLHLRQINDTFNITVNGKKSVCGPTFGTPFELDLSQNVVPGKNEIEIHFYHKDLNGHKFLTNRGNDNNILPPAYLEITSPVYIADIAVDTRVVPQKVFKARIELENITNKECKAVLTGGVSRKWNENALLKDAWEQKHSVVIPVKGKRSVEISHPWEDVQLWSPDTPNLYIFDLTLEENGKKADAYRERFGFRHFQVEGHRFLLNGHPFIARSGWGGNWKTREERIAGMKLLKQRGHNTIRSFLPGDLGSVIEAADEAGMLIATCAETNNGGGGWAERQNPEFWKRYTDHILAIAMAWRNHPSIILWGLGCEFGAIYCGEGSPREKSLSDNLSEAGRKLMELDPTRTWTEYGGVEAGNPVKGPGPAPTRSFHYPFNTCAVGNELPDIAYWYADGRVSWHRINDRKKPTIIPEDLYHGMQDQHLGMTKFANDSIYSEDGYLDALRYAFQMFAEGYYCGGLALWEPWMTYASEPFNRLYENGFQPIPDFLIAMRPFHRNLYAGETAEYKFYAYNQIFTTLNCELVRKDSLNGKEILSETKKIIMPPGVKLEELLVLHAPDVKQVSDYTVSFELRNSRNGTVLCKRNFTMNLFPRKTTLTVQGNTALVANPDSILRKSAFPKGVYTEIADAVKSGADRIVVDKTLTPQEGKALSLFVEKGGRVLALDLKEDSWTPVQYEYQKPMTFVWRRTGDRMKDVKEVWLRSWKTDGRVGYSNIPKSAKEDMAVLFDSGHMDGLTGANIAWLFRKNGAWLLSQLPFTERFESEPCAPFVLQSLMDEFTKRNADTFSLKKKVVLENDPEPIRERTFTDTSLVWPGAKEFRTLTLNGPSYADLFRSAGILTEKEINAGPDKVLVLDVSGGISEKQTKLIDEFCEKGAVVLLSELPEDTDPELLKKFGVTLKNPAIPAVDANGTLIPDKRPHTYGEYPHWINRKSANGLLQGLSNDDFFWSKGSEMWSWGRYLQIRTFPPKRIKKDSSILYAVIEALPGSRTNVLTEPGGIAETPYKNGNVILSTLRFKTFAAEYNRKVVYVLRTLLNNLECRTSEAEKVFTPVFLDLSQLMNRNFWNDPKYQKKDGSFEPAGWFGDENDMRYFPVNLCGWSTTANNFCPKDQFPEKPLNLGGKTFRLTNPEQNGGKGCIILKNAEEIKIELDTPMKINQIYFLGAAQQWEGALEISFNGMKCPELYTAKDHFNGYRYASAKSAGKIAWVGETPKDSTAGLWFWKVPNPVPENEIHTITLKNVTGKDNHAIAVIAATAEQEI